MHTTRIEANGTDSEVIDKDKTGDGEEGKDPQACQRMNRYDPEQNCKSTNTHSMTKQGTARTELAERHLVESEGNRQGAGSLKHSGADLSDAPAWTHTTRKEGTRMREVEDG